MTLNFIEWWGFSSRDLESVEYSLLTVYPAEEKDFFRRDILDMTVNFIKWWGSYSRDLRSVEYPIIVITPRSLKPRVV